MDERGPIFKFQGDAAGYFLDVEPPRQPGSYRYRAFRSAEHQAMHDHLQDGDPPRCYYEADGERVHFTVVSAPDYGVLELADFTTDAHTKPQP
jgi:hypothetical protein